MSKSWCPRSGRLRRCSELRCRRPRHGKSAASYKAALARDGAALLPDDMARLDDGHELVARCAPQRRPPWRHRLGGRGAVSGRRGGWRLFGASRGWQVNKQGEPEVWQLWYSYSTRHERANGGVQGVVRRRGPRPGPPGSPARSFASQGVNLAPGIPIPHPRCGDGPAWATRRARIEPR